MTGLQTGGSWEPERPSTITRVTTLAPLALVAIVFAAAVAAAGAWSPRFDLLTIVFIAVCVVWGAVQVAVGTVISLRRPENRVGRLLQTSGVLVAAAFAGYFLAAIRMETSGTEDLVGGIAGWWASSTLFVALYTAFPLLGLLFPDGSLPGPRWRLPVILITAGIVGCCGLFAIAAGPLGPDLPRNPFGLVALPPGAWAAASGTGTILLVVAMALAIAAVLVRWRRGGPRERSQLKWLAAAIAASGVLFTISFGGEAEAVSPLAILGVGSASLIPLAIGVAVLRYRLYDIDRLVSRTIGYAIVTAALAGVFFGVVLVLGTVLSGIAEGETLAVAASTLVAFALFQPLRRRVQDIVDRRFDRARVDAQRAVDLFAARVREDPDPGAVHRRLLVAATGAVHPRGAAVWIRGETR